MTRKQIKGLLKLSSQLVNYLNGIKDQKTIKNKNIVNEIRQNIQGEIDRLIEWEKD